MSSGQPRRGHFITTEGIEGCGKTTQARLLATRLRREGHTVLLTAEPGGTKLGRSIRAALLTAGRRVHPLAEWLLFEADRAQHVRETIEPALRRGAVVICDRYSDSTRAYQGYGRGLGLSFVDRVDRIATGGLRPDLTLLLDLPVREGLARARRRGRGG
ncbi:MAG: dTMP kinase, partial [bacterium]